MITGGKGGAKTLTMIAEEEMEEEEGEKLS